jgi:hypothetical protein
VRNGPYPNSENPSAEQKNIVLRASNVRTTHARDSQPHPSMLAISVDQVFDAISRYVGNRK